MRRLALASLLVPTLAAAAPALVPDKVIIVGRASETAPWTDAATEARLDDHAELAAVVLAHRGKQRLILAPDGIGDVRIGGRKEKTAPFADLGGVRVQWSTVEPHGFRDEAAANGATSMFYSNVATEGPSFGRWLGYDHIDYFERVVQPWSASARIAAEVTAGEPDAQQVAGLGTVRFKVELQAASGVTLASPGLEATDTYGLTRAVHRVSIRKSDDFLGWLSAYLLVPEVFGSAGGGRDHQTERFTGADCADVMVGAWRRTGKGVAYTNVAGLPSYAKIVTPSTEIDDRGMPEAPITGVKAGDLIRIDYGGTLRNHTPRAFDHVAALWEDKSDPAGPFKGGADGQLDGFDLVIHMGHPRLVIEPLARQAPATIDVLRWRQPGQK